MCAPGDQRNSSDNQCEQAELNAVQYLRRVDVSETSDLRGKPEMFRRSLVEESIRGMGGYGTTAHGGKVAVQVCGWT